MKTGSTSWMPPALPLGVAVLYFAFDGDRASVVLGFYICQLIAACYVFFQLAAIGLRQLPVPVALALLIVGAATFFLQLFCFTHGHVFEMTCALVLFKALSALQPDLSRITKRGLGECRRPVIAGLVIGATALISPALALSSSLILAFRLFRNPRLLIISLLVTVAVVSPWIGRNYRVFEKIVPIKSNAAFEAWQAMVVDNDGILDSTTLVSHPYVSVGVQARRYSALGEADFMEEMC